MNDAPPVTKTVFPAQNPSAVVTLVQPPHFLSDSQMINDFREFLQFLDSIIVGSSGPRRFTHLPQASGVVRKIADGFYEVFQPIERTIHISTARLFHNVIDVAPLRRETEYRLSRRQNSIQSTVHHA